MCYNKERLDELQEIVYSAVVADILDELGIKNFAMEDKLKCLSGSNTLIGYARTLYAVDVFEIPEEPYKLDLEFIDSLKEGDVIVSTVNGNNHNGFYGELLTTATLVRGGRGAVIEGYARDVKMIRDLDFPLYCLGTNPLDSKGRVDCIEADKPIICSGVKVHSGDLICADIDGIVVIPKDYIEEVIDKAVEKVTAENVVRDELRAGESIKVVFDKYSIL